MLKIGNKGEEVKRLQEALGINNDGIFGKQTEEAVKLFQKKNGLEVDGIVGDKTWSALGFKDEINIIKMPLGVHISKAPNREIKYIAIHFTAGSSSKAGSAKSVKNVFESRKASADFCVDDKDMVQFNPDLNNYYCWAVGDKKSNSNGGKLYGIAKNSNTISIELCSTCTPATSKTVSLSNHSGWSFTDAVINNAVKLTKILMKKFNIDKDHVVRHYDISGKLCPGIVGWNDDPLYNPETKKRTGQKNNSNEWIKFKEKLG